MLGAWQRIRLVLLWAVIGGLLLPVLSPGEALAGPGLERALPDIGAPISGSNWQGQGLRLDLEPWVGRMSGAQVPSFFVPEAAEAGGGGGAAGGSRSGIWPGHHNDSDRRQWWMSWLGAGEGLVLAIGLHVLLGATLGRVSEDAPLVLALAGYALLPPTFASLHNRAPFGVNMLGSVILAVAVLAGLTLGVVMGFVLALLFTAGSDPASEDGGPGNTAAVLAGFGLGILLGLSMGLFVGSLGPAIAFGRWAKRHPESNARAEAKLSPLAMVLPRHRRLELQAEAVGGLQLALSF